MVTPSPWITTVPPRRAVLQPHPNCRPWPQLLAVAARVRLGRDGRWYLQFALCGDLTAVVVPAPALPAAVDGLWQHTCFEAFIGVPDSAAYYEVNIAPSGQWATYYFTQYRQRVPALDHHWQPHIRCRQHAQAVLVQLVLPPVPEQSAVTTAAIWTVGMAAVLAATDGTVSYWAGQHPAAQPDFHQRDGWQALPLGGAT